MAAEPLEASYMGLMRVPGFARVALGTVLGRLAGSMWEIVLVLFVLQRYRSPALVGLTLLLALFPGLIFSPIAGSLLDRQGRVRLMVFDYSITAARSLFPLMVPRHLWDRSNGLDSSSYSLTSIIGPAIAGLATARFSPEVAVLATGVVVGVAALSLLGVPEPIERTAPGGSLFGDAWASLRYVLANATLRGLAGAMFFTNVGSGPLLIGIPLVVLHRLHAGPDTVGQVFAVSGIAGLMAGLLAGRLKTEGRERPLMAIGVATWAPAMVALALTNSLAVVFAVGAVTGAASAVSNLGVFALRQRRIDPRWFGRGFAVSMSLNMAGIPIGSALAGPLFVRSISLPLILGAGMTLVGAAACMVLIPKRAAL